MRLLSSNALWWLLLAAILIFFYLLKLKRKRTVVPTVILWKRALEEVEANVPFKKLRRSLLLLLQLLALAALVFALARPLVTTRALASGNTVIVIDSTASMGAKDESGVSRLDRVRNIAREMVDGLGSGDRAAIIESSSRVTIRCPLTADRSALAEAIADIRQTDATGSLADALRLAEQITTNELDAGVVILSDGGGTPASIDPSTQQLTITKAVSKAVRFIRVGQRADNVGIVAMNSRQASATSREVFASIANFGDRDRTLGIELMVENKLVDARTIEVAAKDRRAVVFESVRSDGTLAELKLDVQDDLEADNVAFAFLSSSHQIRVGVMSENPFLLQALAANPQLIVTKFGPGSNSSEFDCLVTDNSGVTELNRPMLAINPRDATGLWRSIGQRDNPEITSVDHSHPVNSFLNYDDLHIEGVTNRERAPWLKPIVTAGSDPLICAGDDGNRRIVLIGFDLARSDLPLKVEFPILLSNAMSWLAGNDSAEVERTIRTGEPMTIRTAAERTRITTPGGDTNDVVARDGSVVFADTLQTGIYTVGDGASFAASLLSEAESNTAPRDSIRTRDGELSVQSKTFSSEREVWRWLALLVIAVLMIEWWAYHRRIA